MWECSTVPSPSQTYFSNLETTFPLMMSRDSYYNFPWKTLTIFLHLFSHSLGYLTLWILVLRIHQFSRYFLLWNFFFKKTGVSKNNLNYFIYFTVSPFYNLIVFYNSIPRFFIFCEHDVTVTKPVIIKISLWTQVNILIKILYKIVWKLSKLGWFFRSITDAGECLCKNEEV